jgi:hypothetical protein
MVVGVVEQVRRVLEEKLNEVKQVYEGLKTLGPLLTELRDTTEKLVITIDEIKTIIRRANGAIQDARELPSEASEDP